MGVRSAMFGDTNRRKLSFRNVSNVVVQLLHTIKYSAEAPFSHLSPPNVFNGDIPYINKNGRQVFSQHIECLIRR